MPDGTAHRALSRARGYSFVAGSVLLALGVMPLAACNMKDAEKCSDAQQTARKAIASEQFDLARQWREYAYKHCDDSAALGALDQEIVQAEANVKKRAAEAEAKAKADQALLDLFTSFVSGNRAAPENASKNPECEDPKPGQGKKDHWCEATRTAGEHTFHIRYFESDPKLVRFHAKLSQPMNCDALGANRVIREWDVPSTSGPAVKRRHCEMTGGSLAGLQVVTTEALGANTYVFTQEYLDKDGWMKNYVGK